MAWKIHSYRRVRCLFLLLFCALFFLGYELGSKANFLLVPVTRLVLGDVSAEWKIIGYGEKSVTDRVGEILPAASYDSSSPEYVEDESKGFWLTAVQEMITVNFTDPRTFFESQVALINTAQPVTAEPEPILDGNELENTLSEPLSQGAKYNGTDPLVALYCTHNAESYIPAQGKEKLEGKNGGVFMVAQHLEETLEKEYGISVVLSDTIHDYPDWSKSYTNSLVTVETLKKAHPSVKMFIDVHRDAQTSHESTTAEFNGKNAARVMFIVGSDARLSHPNWRKNWEFANRVSKQAEKLYPGFVKGVRVQDGRYNQHVSTCCLLLEVGGTENTLEEAKLAVEMLADAINLVVMDVEE